jgi:hypothetical protein
MRFLLLLALPLSLRAQPSFNANNAVPPLNITFGYGVNLGYYPPFYYDMELATLAHGTPDGSVPGVGVTTVRPALPEDFLDHWGYDARKEHFQHYNDIGLHNTVVIAGYPADHHRDEAFYCAGQRSELFKNLYEPIWDNGENGTPVNDNNPCALYMWKVMQRYKGNIKIFEVWNEPDGVISGWGEGLPGQPGNWWDAPPPPCEVAIRTPVFFYIRMMRICYEVVKSVDPNTMIAVGGLGSPGFLDAICRYTDEPFNGDIETKYPRKGGAYFDVMSFHAYPHLDNSMRSWDNNTQDFRYFRHSDAAVAGIWQLRDRFRDVLEKYGYNGQTYPKKHWICTEFNLPRRAYGDFIGSNEAQANFIVKALIEAQMQDVAQMHLYALADEVVESAATSEFHHMGLFKNLNNLRPFEGEMTVAAHAYKSTEAILGNATYDRVQTNRMALPAGVKGAAFRDNDNQEYIYALWAETHVDRSEDAKATYAFPESFGLKFLDTRSWNYSNTNASYLSNAKQVQLSGSPQYFRAVQVTN